jgi:hypothetical protein
MHTSAAATQQLLACKGQTMPAETPALAPLLLQGILMRTTESYDTLPQLLKESNALTMTVPQSKASPCRIAEHLHTRHN